MDLVPPRLEQIPAGGRDVPADSAVRFCLFRARATPEHAGVRKERRAGPACGAQRATSAAKGNGENSSLLELGQRLGVPERRIFCVAAEEKRETRQQAPAAKLKKSPARLGVGGRQKAVKQGRKAAYDTSLQRAERRHAIPVQLLFGPAMPRPEASVRDPQPG